MGNYNITKIYSLSADTARIFEAKLFAFGQVLHFYKQYVIIKSCDDKVHL